MYRIYNTENRKRICENMSPDFKFFLTYPSCKYPLTLTILSALSPNLKVSGTRKFCFNLCVTPPQGSRLIRSSKSRKASEALEVSECGRRDGGTNVSVVVILGGKPILRTGSRNSGAGFRPPQREAETQAAGPSGAKVGV